MAYILQGTTWVYAGGSVNLPPVQAGQSVVMSGGETYRATPTAESEYAKTHWVETSPSTSLTYAGQSYNAPLGFTSTGEVRTPTNIPATATSPEEAQKIANAPSVIFQAGSTSKGFQGAVQSIVEQVKQGDKSIQAPSQPVYFEDFGGYYKTEGKPESYVKGSGTQALIPNPITYTPIVQPSLPTWEEVTSAPINVYTGKGNETKKYGSEELIKSGNAKSVYNPYSYKVGYAEVGGYKYPIYKIPILTIGYGTDMYYGNDKNIAFTPEQNKALRIRSIETGIFWGVTAGLTLAGILPEVKLPSFRGGGGGRGMKIPKLPYIEEVEKPADIYKLLELEKGTKIDDITKKLKEESTIKEANEFIKTGIGTEVPRVVITTPYGDLIVYPKEPVVKPDIVIEPKIPTPEVTTKIPELPFYPEEFTIQDIQTYPQPQPKTPAIISDIPLQPPPIPKISKGIPELPYLPDDVIIGRRGYNPLLEDLKFEGRLIDLTKETTWAEKFEASERKPVSQAERNIELAKLEKLMNQEPKIDIGVREENMFKVQAPIVRVTSDFVPELPAMPDEWKIAEIQQPKAPKIKPKPISDIPKLPYAPEEYADMFNPTYDVWNRKVEISNRRLTPQERLTIQRALEEKNLPSDLSQHFGALEREPVSQAERQTESRITKLMKELEDTIFKRKEGKTIIDLFTNKVQNINNEIRALLGKERLPTTWDLESEAKLYRKLKYLETGIGTNFKPRIVKTEFGDIIVSKNPNPPAPKKLNIDTKDILKGTEPKEVKGGKGTSQLQITKTEEATGTKQVGGEGKLIQKVKMDMQEFMPVSYTKTLQAQIQREISLVAPVTIQQQKQSQSQSQKQMQKLMQQLDIGSMSDTGIKTLTKTIEADMQKQKQNIKTMTEEKIPTIVIPKIKWGDIERKPKITKERTKARQGLAYIPDFTAKVFDIGVKGLSNQQINQILKKSYSGLEIRKGIIL